MFKTRCLQIISLAVVLSFPVKMAGQVQVQVSDQKIVSEGKVFYMHEVQKGQTLYSISKAYKVPINAITSVNIISESGIQTGQVLKIPVAAAQVTSQTKPQAAASVRQAAETGSQGQAVPQIEISGNKIVSHDRVYYMHEVMKGQTLYSIARAYKVTIIDITRENVIPASGIYAGQVLKIPASSSLKLTDADALPPARVKDEPNVQANATDRPAVNEPVVTEPPVRETKTAETSPKTTPETYRTHRVRKGETLYSISRDYNVTVGALLKVNNVPRNEIEVGQILNIPASDYEVIVKDEMAPEAKPKEQPAAEWQATPAEAQPAAIVTEKPQQSEVKTQTPAQEVKKAAPQPEKKKVHKVQKGESLSDIAKKYGITVKELKDANKGVIFAMPDMKLVIPVRDDSEDTENR